MPFHVTRRYLACLVGAPLLSPCSPLAEEAPASQRMRHVLTIDGAVSRPHGADGAIHLGMDELEAIDQRSITATTPWYDTPQVFSGLSMAALMAAVGAHGSKVTVRALNGYATEIPMSDFAQHGVILATRRNAQRMSVRDKGPLFVMYPFDDDRSLQSERYYARCAWSANRITVS